jgi:O-6-methylguanine DNA methyltransferase
MTETVIVGPVETSAGIYGAVLSEAGLVRLTFPSEPLAKCEVWADRWFPTAECVVDEERLGLVGEQLTAYFGGRLREFSLPIDLRGSAFQVDVWKELLSIPYGTSRSYAQVATAIGRPSAVRAVGAANGANPVPIVVPCHRVIGSNGALTGYGGGLDLKTRLLELEGVTWRGARP